jgi:hypothetical protein
VLGLSLQFLFLLISEWGAPTNSLKKERKKERKSEPFEWSITKIFGKWGSLPNIKT